MAESDNECKVYVGSLKFETNEDRLKDHFSSIGAVVKAQVIRDWETGRSRGFGFVTFNDSSSVTEACERLNETELDGRTIKVHKANSRGGGGSSEGRTRGGRGGRGGGYGRGRRGGFSGGGGGYGGGNFGGGSTYAQGYTGGGGGDGSGNYYYSGGSGYNY
ncbi:uncharacterized protein [Pocillopora verrucosa]|uniref:uncharacterized protein n=1 Tax=Pocillopora verrucosa TaxID=203993 RepID=UPI0033402C75